MKLSLAFLRYPLVIAGFAAAGYVANTFETERHVAAEQLVMTRASASFAAALERRLDERIHLTEAIRSVFEAAPDLSRADFEAMAGRLAFNQPDIINVAAAPGMVIDYIHPREPNLPALGINLAEMPQFERAIDLAISTDQVTIDGPEELVQGGRGLITRAAVSGIGLSEAENAVWGVVSVVVDIDMFFQSAVSAFDDIDFEVGVTSPEDGLVFGTELPEEANPVTSDVSVAGLNWQVSVAPLGGWTQVSPYRAEVWGATFLICLTCLMLMRWFSAVSMRTRRAEVQLEEALEALEDAFALYDADDRLIMCNERYKNVYSASAEAMVPGARFEDILRFGLANQQYSDAIGREEEWLEERLKAHRQTGLTVEQPLENGRWVRVVERKTPSGNTVGFRVDITELKRALEKSEAASRAKSTFLNTISHELRTPLTVVLGYNAFVKQPRKLPSFQALQKAIETGNVSDAARALPVFQNDLERFGGQIDISGQQLLALISTILDLAAIEEGPINMTLERLDLSEVASDVIEQFRPLAQEKNVQLVNEASAAFVDADALRLRQILFNLIGNALKFTTDGTVTVRTGMKDGGALMEVEDTGCGIASKDIRTIFDKFAKVESEHLKGNTGAGLGLAISRELAELHGGELSVESTEGQGSVFRLHLKSAPQTSSAAA